MAFDTSSQSTGTQPSSSGSTSIVRKVGGMVFPSPVQIATGQRSAEVQRVASDGPDLTVGGEGGNPDRPYTPGRALGSYTLPTCVFNPSEFSLDRTNLPRGFGKDAVRLFSVSDASSLAPRVEDISVVNTLTGTFPQNIVIRPDPGTGGYLAQAIRITHSINDNTNALPLDFRLTGKYDRGQLVSQILPKGYARFKMQMKLRGAFIFYIILMGWDEDMFPAPWRCSDTDPINMEVTAGTTGASIIAEVVDCQNDELVRMLTESAGAPMLDSMLVALKNQIRGGR